MQIWGQSLQDLFLRGGFVMWPLLGFSILAFAIALERAVVFLSCMSSYSQLISNLKEKIQDRSISQVKEFLQTAKGPLARVAEVYMHHSDSPAKLREEVVNREASIHINYLEKRLNWLAIIGNLAPMLGLLGTVAGLIDCFHNIEVLGGQVQPGDLAAGIWKALLTTVFGLTIALPTVGVYHFFENRIGLLSLKIEWLISYLDEWMAEKAGTRLESQTQEPADQEKSTPQSPNSRNKKKQQVAVEVGS